MLAHRKIIPARSTQSFTVTDASMNLNTKSTLFIALTISIEFRLPAVQSCLPRLGSSAGVPIFWSFFSGGQEDDESPTVYDKVTLERSKWTTVDWIQKHKYALELHNLTTEDGYQLQLQRMPKPKLQPILLVHGLFMSSLSWVMMGPGKSLAFMLYDKGYDVWLANLRGSLYGRTHESFNVTDANFWNYSFHEMGVYDMPAIIDHMRKESSFEQVMLIGHSQASSAFLALFAVRPEYNEQVHLVQALAPIVELRDYVKFSTQDVRKVMKFVKSKLKSQSYEMFPPGDLRQNCLEASSEKRKECRRYLKLFSGSGDYSRSMEPIFYGQLLQGGSLKEVQHLHQIWKSGDFVAYDYDPAGNRLQYNSVEPFNYNLNLVTVPTILHFGVTDAIATPAGVHNIYANLLGNVRGVYHVTATSFNHLDFICANDVKRLVNEKLIDLMEKYLAGKLLYVIN